MGEVATEDMKEATEAVMLTANGEVTEAAMEVTEEVTPQDLEAKPHGVWPVVWEEEAGVDPVAPETSLTKKRYKQKEREKKETSKIFPALNLLCSLKFKNKNPTKNRTKNQTKYLRL